MSPSPGQRGCRNSQKSQGEAHWGCIRGWPQASPGSQPHLPSDHLTQFCWTPPFAVNLEITQTSSMQVPRALALHTTFKGVSQHSSTCSALRESPISPQTPTSDAFLAVPRQPPNRSVTKTPGIRHTSRDHKQKNNSNSWSVSSTASPFPMQGQSQPFSSGTAQPGAANLAGAQSAAGSPG